MRQIRTIRSAATITVTAALALTGLVSPAIASTAGGGHLNSVARPHAAAATAPAPTAAPSGAVPAGVDTTTHAAVPVPQIARARSSRTSGLYRNAAALVNSRYGGLVNSGESSSGVAMNVGIVSYAPWNPSIWQHWYQSQVGAGLLPAGARTPKTISVGGAQATTTATAGNWQTSQELDVAEIAMDTETITAIAPRAQIYVFVANSSMEMLSVLASNAERHAIQVITDSHGGCEGNHSISELNSMSQYLYNIDRSGVPYFASSGDHGAYCQNPALKTKYMVDTSTPGIDMMASSPYVVAVGGTAETRGASPSAWEETNDGSNVYWGSGGGYSRYWAAPSYQSSLGVSSRAIPDVAADASQNTGVQVWDGLTSSTGAGTSLAAPVWAGIAAQLLASLSPPGQVAMYGSWELLAQLYTHPWLFHDVVAGGNRDLVTRTGWDDATGLGTPITTSLIGTLGGSYGGALTRPAHPTITIHVKKHTIKVHHHTTVVVHVAPAGKVKVLVWVHGAHGWRKTGHVTTDANGNVGIRFTGLRRGKDLYGLTVPKFNDLSSKLFRIRVR